jgi:hypothetical protein
MYMGKILKPTRDTSNRAEFDSMQSSRASNLVRNRLFGRNKLKLSLNMPGAGFEPATSGIGRLVPFLSRL